MNEVDLNTKITSFDLIQLNKYKQLKTNIPEWNNSWTTRIRTWNNSAKNCCVTVTP